MKRDRFLRFLQIGGLFNLGVLHPVFDVLSHSPDFLIIRDIGPAALLSFVVVVSVGIPSGLFFIEVLSGKAEPIPHLVLITVLLWVNVLFLAAKLNLASAATNLVICAFVAFAVSAAYHYFGGVRSFISFLSIALIAVPLMFLFHPSIQKLVFPRKIPIENLEIPNETPVVLIVFDEFPLNSLLNEDMEIDSIRYPHFSYLMRQFTWYRNATGVSGSTPKAVPAILTGNVTTLNDLPILSDHPRNLFTLLGGSYRMDVFESITRLCPNPVWQPRKPGFFDQQEMLFRSFRIIYSNIVFPNSESSDAVGDIPIAWIDLFLKQAINARLGLFNRFLSSMTPEPRRAVYFIHVLLPHQPYQFLPSGKRYVGEGGLGNTPLDLTGSDDQKDRRLEQMGLLQIGFVDSLIGRLTRKLHATHLYDRALIVITADHGMSYVPGQPRRTATNVNYPSILSVPLFVKMPYQKKGKIDDRNIETIDILPTIAETLGIQVPWETQGKSLLHKGPLRDSKSFINIDTNKVLHFGSSIWPQNRKFVEDKIKMFGTDRFPVWILTNPFKDFIGTSVRQNPAIKNPDIVAELFEEERYKHIDPKSSFIPALIIAQLHLRKPPSGKSQIGIAVNGTIHAVASAIPFKPDLQIVGAVVPEDAFRKGSNDIQFFLLKDSKSIELLEKQSQSGLRH